MGRPALFAVLILNLLISPQAWTDKIPDAADLTTVEFSPMLPEAPKLVLGVFSGGHLGEYGSKIDAASDGALSLVIEASEFEAKPLATQTVVAPRETGFQQIVLLGLGSADEEKSDLEWQELGGKAVQAGVAMSKGEVVIVFDVEAKVAANIAYGAVLGSYYFDKYYSDDERKKSVAKIHLVTPSPDEAQTQYERELKPVASAIWLTRDVSNEPANVIYPESFVEFWKQQFKSLGGVKVKVLNEKMIRKEGMNALYGVGQGSEHPPRVMIVEYRGGKKDEPPVVIVGKGITFDSGGISIKPWRSMWEMKFDMSGAASALGTVYALAGRAAEVNVVAIAALAENMPSATAQRPGDVLTSYSGKTIEVLQTDAEGRLVLADTLAYADMTYDPALLVDIATLTGTVSEALGKDYAGLFTRHDELVLGFIERGETTGESLWHLPLNENHFKALESQVADMTNFAMKGPGASTAAAFLGNFVRETTPWVHLDVAGVAWNDKAVPLKSSPGATAFAIRLLNDYIAKEYEIELP